MTIPSVVFLLVIAVLVISWVVRKARSLVAEITTFVCLAIVFVIYPPVRQLIEFIISWITYGFRLLVDRLQGRAVTPGPNFNFGTNTRIADFVIIAVLGFLSIALGSVYGASAKNKRLILGFIVRVFNLLLFAGFLIYYSGVSLPGVPILDNLRIDMPTISVPDINVTGATGPNPLGPFIDWARWIVLGIAFFFLMLLFFSPPFTTVKPGQPGKPRPRYGLLLFVGTGLAIAVAVVAFGAGGIVRR
jgi:hypothetical protein